MSPQPLTIGISSCLLGEPVRYDGRHQRDALLVERLSARFSLIPCCPEVAIGLGVPRPPIQLVEIHNQVHAVGVADPERDVTQALQDVARMFLQQHEHIAGYVFKSRSPSCGVGSTPVYRGNTCLHQQGDGIFAAMLMQIKPALPVADECQLQDPVLQAGFIEKVVAYSGARQSS